ncbi:GNAT family N-acetyltransferase [Streptomyces griseoincarnatus]
MLIETGQAALHDPTWDEVAAEAGSIFHTSGFLLSWWRDRAQRRPDSSLITVRSVDGTGRTCGQCAFEVRDQVLQFAGGSDVVDYMGPVARPGYERTFAADLAETVNDRLTWQFAALAGLVSDSQLTQEFIRALTTRGMRPQPRVYDRAPRIRQAPTGYLAQLSSKRRSEVLRKRKRLTDAVGATTVVPSTAHTHGAALDRLLAWKATASPATGAFVTTYGPFMRTLVAELAAAKVARIVELHARDRPIASAIELTHGRIRYLYNMAYDLPLTTASLHGISPGVVLVSHMAEDALAAGFEFDFLKGAQDYKLRLGGTPEELLVIDLGR